MKKAIEIVTINDLFVIITKDEDKLRGAAKDRAIEAVNIIMDELQDWDKPVSDLISWCGANVDKRYARLFLFDLEYYINLAVREVEDFLELYDNLLKKQSNLPGMVSNHQQQDMIVYPGSIVVQMGSTLNIRLFQQ